MDKLAAAMGYSRASSIQRYESPEEFRGEWLPPKLVAKMVAALAGRGDPPISELEILALGGPLLERQTVRNIPVVSYVHAGKWTEISDPYEKGNGFDYIRADRHVGAKAFALEIRGTSMLPIFQEGDRVIIDPEIEPSPGDFVVAKEEMEEAATFKQYRPRGVDAKRRPIIELRPLNDAWPAIIIDSHNPGRIIGTMVEHHSYRRA